MTCLILTRDRPLWLPYAARCAQYQTYPNKEILVVADGQDVKDLIPDDPQIRYIYSPNFGTIGNKRNAGCFEARGEIVCHFDDDDWSSPERLGDQISRLIDSGARCAGYHTLRFTDGPRWWRYHLNRSYVPGTTLCYWKSHWESNRFPDRQVNEDGAFVNASLGMLVAEDAGDLMFATIHSLNTSPRDLSAEQWTEIEAPGERR